MASRNVCDGFELATFAFPLMARVAAASVSGGVAMEVDGEFSCVLTWQVYAINYQSRYLVLGL